MCFFFILYTNLKTIKGVVKMEHYINVYCQSNNQKNFAKALKKSELDSFLKLNQQHFKEVIVVDPRNRSEQILSF